MGRSESFKVAGIVLFLSMGNGKFCIFSPSFLILVLLFPFTFVFRWGHPSLYEGMSVRRSVRRSALSLKAGKRLYCPCPTAATFAG